MVKSARIAQPGLRKNIPPDKSAPDEQGALNWRQVNPSGRPARFALQFTQLALLCLWLLARPALGAACTASSTLTPPTAEPDFTYDIRSGSSPKQWSFGQWTSSDGCTFTEVAGSLTLTSNPDGFATLF